MWSAVQDAPLAIIETVEIVQRRFSEVDEAHAHDEGEGDRSLTYWRDAHRQYFSRRGQFAEDMLLCCERFRVVERLTGSTNTFDVVDATIDDIHAAMRSGALTCTQLVQSYLDRIAAYDQAGPK